MEKISCLLSRLSLCVLNKGLKNWLKAKLRFFANNRSSEHKIGDRQKGWVEFREKTIDSSALFGTALNRAKQKSAAPDGFQRSAVCASFGRSCYGCKVTEVGMVSWKKLIVLALWSVMNLHFEWSQESNNSVPLWNVYCGRKKCVKIMKKSSKITDVINEHNMNQLSQRHEMSSL